VVSPIPYQADAVSHNYFDVNANNILF